MLPNCDGCGVDPPILRAGVPGLLVAHAQHGTDRASTWAALSDDGITWVRLPDSAFPPAFQFSDLVAFGPGFVAVGDTGGDHIRPLALSSTDGRGWTARTVPVGGLDPSTEPSANRIVAARDGLVALGNDGLAPGAELWWRSAAGVSWNRLRDYPPLGTWTGEGEGSGLAPDGTLLGDGARMLAYRAGAAPAAWTSTDGWSWRPLVVAGSPSPGSGSLVLLPIGLLALQEDGSVWLGVPE
jgi:hypothetical protein